MDTNPTRRPISARDTRWAAEIARRLGNAGLRPNHISLLSIAFAAAAGAAFVRPAGYASSGTVRGVGFLVAAVAIPLRMLCNLFDGMVAIEGGFRSKSGEVYNELPDRFSDALILAGAGYSFPDFAWLSGLGWCAAVLAVITAYVRALGASAGTRQYFLGPMAKPQRMTVMTLAALAGAAGEWVAIRGVPVAVALGIIVAGCLLTIGRRCRRIVRELEAR